MANGRKQQLYVLELETQFNNCVQLTHFAVVLLQYFHLLKAAVSDSFLFMDDNAAFRISVLLKTHSPEIVSIHDVIWITRVSYLYPTEN